MHVAYQHTSHGTHVSYGIYGLPDFKSGDDVLFAITNSGTSVAGKLDFHDYGLQSYCPLEQHRTYLDLSVNETTFIQTTRNFLNDAVNADINVVMWSWCSIAGHIFPAIILKEWTLLSVNIALAVLKLA